jgi:hypothetical protein
MVFIIRPTGKLKPVSNTDVRRFYAWKKTLLVNGIRGLNKINKLYLPQYILLFSYTAVTFINKHKVIAKPTINSFGIC